MAGLLHGLVQITRIRHEDMRRNNTLKSKPLEVVQSQSQVQDAFVLISLQLRSTSGETARRAHLVLYNSSGSGRPAASSAYSDFDKSPITSVPCWSCSHNIRRSYMPAC